MRQSVRAAACGALVWAGATSGSWAAAGGEHAGLSDLPLNRVQVIGTHNSYKRLIQPELFAGMLLQYPEAASLDYGHPPMPEQLDLGVRGLEIDVYTDPVGGHYANPLGNRLLRAQGVEPLPFNTEGELDGPGFKVLHDCNFDFRSHTPRLEDTLAGLRHWSALNPGHLPVFVTMNLKQGDPPVPGGIDPVEWDPAALDALDAALLAGLGRENLLLPDDVRRGAGSLVEAIEAWGWPSVGDCRGRFVFVLDEGGATREAYLQEHAALAGRVLFTSGPADAADAVILVMNEPAERAGEIRGLVERGRIVRTRADAGTTEMRAGDLSRFEAAKASGAQVITTDYPVPDTRHNAGYAVRFAEGVYARAHPGLDGQGR